MWEREAGGEMPEEEVGTSITVAQPSGSGSLKASRTHTPGGEGGASCVHRAAEAPEGRAAASGALSRILPSGEKPQWVKV